MSNRQPQTERLTERDTEAEITRAPVKMSERYLQLQLRQKGLTQWLSVQQHFEKFISIQASDPVPNPLQQIRPSED